MRRPCCAALLAVTALACVGTIEEPAAALQPGAAVDAAPGEPTLAAPATAPEARDVNRVDLHRLNNTEYHNTVRELLGVDSTPAASFIGDEKAYGFDNIASALGMTDAQYEQYWSAADELVERVFADPSAVGNVPNDYDRGVHASLMIDLVVMALACDITRVVSFMLDDARSDFVYNFIPMRKFSATGSEQASGAVGGYHGAQHAGDRNNGFATIGHWNAQKAAELASKLHAIPDAGGGSMLDHSVITFASGMHGGNHDAADLPVALIGGGGVLATDRHLVFDQEQPLANVHLTLMQSVFGCPDQSFGSSTGAIPELLHG